MSNLDFFKNEAKKFLTDWQTQTQTVESDGIIIYHYDWKFYDVDDLFYFFEWDDKDRQEIKLARAQHIIAKIAGYKNWNELIIKSEVELELAELLLRRFKNSDAIMDWVQTVEYTGIGQYGVEAVLDYAKQYYELGDSKDIVYLPLEQLTILSGKQRLTEINKFDDEHNPAGSLRKSSYVFCPHCQKAYNFNQSKVIKKNGTNLTIVVCKNFPDCRGTYLDNKVLTPTIIYGDARIPELEKGIAAFPHISMNKKIECLHCGDKYFYNEAKVVIDPDDGEAWIHCKNYPECSGNPMDFIDAE